MKHFISRRNFLKAAGVTAAASAMAAAVPQASAGWLTGKDAAVTILYTNDVHTYIDNKSPKLTYAAIAALKQGYVDEGKPVLLVDAGDHIQGTAYGSMDDGATIIELMNEAGYDVATLGNHEFDYGMARAKAVLKEADFPYVSCNWVDLRTGLRVLPAVKLFPAGGKWIAFVGITTPESFTKSTPAYFMNAKQTKYIYDILGGDDGKKLYDAVQKGIDKAKALGADVIIGLGHLGVDPSSSPWTSEEVIANTTGFDAFIDGHSHTVMTASKDNSMVQSTGTGLAYVGAIVIDNATKSIESNGLIDLSAYTKEDAAVKAAADKIISDINAEYGKVFARTDVELNGDKDPGNRTEETNLGDLITDSMLWAIRKDAELTVPAENVVAITNGGGIRAWIHKGDISKLDVNTVLPFGNTVAVVYVTGAELLEALEASTFALPDSLGGFPQIAGMNISIDATKKYDPQTTPYPSGSGKATYYGPASINRVTINSVNGKAFDPNKTYAVVTNNFCAAGGDTYYAFAAASSQFDTGLPLDEVLMDYITTELKGVVGEQYAQPQGRMTITLPAEEPTTPTTPTKPESPKTADTGVVVYGLVAVMAAGAAVVVTSKKRKAI